MVLLLVVGSSTTCLSKSMEVCTSEEAVGRAQNSWRGFAETKWKGGQTSRTEENEDKEKRERGLNSSKYM